MIEQVDGVSRRILKALDSEPRATVGGLAATLQLARGTVGARMARLFAPGYLRPVSTTARTEALGYSIRAYVTAEVAQDEFEQTIRALDRIPEVLECLAVAGQTDLICQVVAVDAADLYRVGQDVLRCPGIRRTATSLVVKDLIPYRTSQLL